MLGQKVFLDIFYEVTLNTLGQNLWGDLEQYACNPEMNLKYDDVLYSTIASENEKELNCSVPFHPLTTSKLTGRIIEVCNTSELGSKAHANFNALHGTGPEEAKNKPCAAIDIFLGLPFIDNHPNNPSQEAYIRLYMKSNVKVKSMIIYYDFSTLAAEIGGYIGMFIGMSLMDFTIKCTAALFKAYTKKLKRKYQETMSVANAITTS